MDELRPAATASGQGWHWPLMHLNEVQSAFTLQVRNTTHGGQLPPQSTSLSVPFLTLSEHVAVVHVPNEQILDWQSASPPQLFPPAHLGHPPPQSTSDS